MGLFGLSRGLHGWVCLDRVEGYMGGFAYNEGRATWVGLFGLSGGLYGCVCLY